MVILLRDFGSWVIMFIDVCCYNRCLCSDVVAIKRENADKGFWTCLRSSRHPDAQFSCLVKYVTCFKVWSSAVRLRVDLYVVTKVAEEHTVFMVKMEAAFFSETLLFVTIVLFLFGTRNLTAT
jgi:hypothetical protein